MLLGGTVFTLLERRRGRHVAAALATSPLERGALGLIAEAFDRPVAAVERDWREELDSMVASAWRVRRGGRRAKGRASWR